MIDFNKKIKSSDKFRGPVLHFQKHGTYCFSPPGTSEYINYWDEQEKYCLDGYTAPDGDYISGYNYFYLNFCPIMRLVEVEKKNSKGQIIKRRIREREFPDFYDYDYYYFSAVQEAEEQGKHMVVLKARGKGFSFKGASMLCRNYYIIPESVSYAFAAEKEFLIKDGILSKAWDILAFIDTHTAWGKKRQKKDQEMHKRASFVTKDEFGNEVEHGYKSEIQGVTLKNDPQKARGKRGRLILWEEAGKFKDILQAWQIARPSVEENGYAYGMMIAFGTGGEEGEDFHGLKELFYKPDGYNVLAFDNIWDDGAQGTTCGFFVPEYSNMSNLDENSKRLFMDDDGNTLESKAREYIIEQRQKVIEGASDVRAIDRYIAEHPVTPQEACLDIRGNIFPKVDLQKQLSKIRTNKKLQNFKQVGDLITEGGKLKWVPKKIGDITNYPLNKDQDPRGSIVIWEHPCQDPPIGLYIAGCDPYDHDQSQSGSLGSTFIYKRINNFDESYDIIVAEYTGRPETAEEYYENVRKLLNYYNARLLYENERKGLHVYFTQKHCDYLLADQPSIINDIVAKSKVIRKKGIHMTQNIKDWGEGLIKEWLNTEYAPGEKNLTKIYSEPLLEELIMYDGKRNTDRAMAFMMVMIYLQQLHNNHVKEVTKEAKNQTYLFGKPLFKNNESSDIYSMFNSKPEVITFGRF